MNHDTMNEPEGSDASTDASPREVELKLSIPEAAVAGLWSHPWVVAHAIGPLRFARLDNRYFDTPDRALAQRHMALRLRRSGTRWVQTLKVADPDGGALSARGEWEMPVAGPALELGRLRGTPLADIASPRTLAARLAPVFITNFRRESRLLRLKDGSLVEFAFDRGDIVAGRGRSRRTSPIREVEIEVKEGAPDLLKCAARLARDLALIPLAASKAERGHRLAAGQVLEAARADLPVPKADVAAGVHLGAVLAACNRALLANAHAVLEAAGSHEADVEFVHQARVAVRRMRSALRTFRPVLARRRTAALDVQLRHLGSMLGQARDLDVLTTTTMKSLHDRVGIDEPGRSALGAILADAEAARVDAHLRLRAYLESAAFSATAIASERFAARSMRGDKRSSTLADCAPAWLSDQRDRVIRRSRRIAVLDDEARHGLRIEVKRLRYALDLLDGLYDDGRVKAFHDALTELQDKLGRLNDAVVADTLLASLPQGEATALVRERYRAWLAHHVKKQLPKVAALAVAFELTDEPWRRDDRTDATERR